MSTSRLDTRAGGIALAVGYVVLIGVLLWRAADGLSAATGSLGRLLFFVVLPAAGVASGAYVVLEWPLGTAVAFLSGSYLAVVGIAMALLSLLSTDPETALTLAGLGLFGLAAFSLVATLRSAVEGLFPAYDLEEEPRQ